MGIAGKPGYPIFFFPFTATTFKGGGAGLTIAPEECVLEGYIMDIAQLEEKETSHTQFIQAQELKSIGRLAGGIAHDFNNLLSVILGYSRLLSEELGSDSHLGDQLYAISAAATRGKNLTRQLFALGGRQVLEKQVVDLNQVVIGFEPLLRRFAGKNVDLKLLLSNLPLIVNVDICQIERVLMNLVLNARDAMSRKGTLTIETSLEKLGATPGDYAMLAVSDTGVGMDPETMDKIFEPFFTTKENGQGTGLGLATVYGIIKQHGGDIWVGSEPGEGTTFKVYLPPHLGAQC